MKFWEFIGWFFKDDEGYPSMMRVVSFLNALAAIFFGILMFSHTKGGSLINPYEFYLSCYFALLAVLGKHAQKIVERYVDKKA